jgi:hypothetical protein
MIITTLFALIGCSNETPVTAPVNPQITEEQATSIAAWLASTNKK